MVQENKTTFTQEEVDTKIRQEIEKQNFAEAMRIYSLSANKMVSDITGDKTKTRVLNMDADTIKSYLEQPDKYINQLIDLSLTLFISIPQYQNIIKYFTDMVILSPYIVPIKINSVLSKLKKEFVESAYMIDKMNVELEYKKAIANTLLSGVFYGYELEEKDSYSIKQFNPKMCRVMGTVNGKNVYAIDFSYFKGKKMLDNKTPLIDSYPPEIQALYRKYESDTTNNRWQMPEVEKQICLRWSDFLNAPSIDVPPLVNLAIEILDIQDYKAMQKTKTEQDNYRYLALEMQTNAKDGEMNKFTVDPSFVSAYYDYLVGVCGGTVTPFISPVPVKEISFGSKMAELNKVQEAQKEFYNSSGVSDSIFNGSTNASGIKISNQVDQNKMFSLYGQIEAILTTKVNVNTNNVYKVKLPRITTFNKSEYATDLLAKATAGLPVHDELMAVCGKSSSEVEGTLTIIDMFDYRNRFIPLQTSYTQSGNTDSAGRPTENVSNLTDSGVATLDSGSNENRVV